MPLQSIINIGSIDQLEAIKQSSDALLILFGGKNCNVCQAIKPRLQNLSSQYYPNMKMVYVDCQAETDICSQNGVFTLPTVQVFFGGHRFIEEVRAFSLGKLQQDIARPYSMIFADQ